MILVTGFGPFPGVEHNPSATAARAVDGLRVGGETLVGLVLPVSYRRAPQAVIELAHTLGARAVVCLGVASRRTRVEVERRATRATDAERPDVDGDLRPEATGPEVLHATAPVDALARALRASVSDDAGTYVCNALLYELVGALPDVPVAFVHVPTAGISRDRLLRGLTAVAAALPAPSLDADRAGPVA